MTAYYNENEIVAGAKFGRLTVATVHRGAKNRHPSAICRCECGNERTVRLTRLRRGQINSCAVCSLRKGWEGRKRNDAEERRKLGCEATYKANSKQRGHDWCLSRIEFRRVIGSPCRYCGTQPSFGIDRIDNSRGYIHGNIVPACASCNYAKRLMTVEQFLDLVRRIYHHSVAS